VQNVNFALVGFCFECIVRRRLYHSSFGFCRGKRTYQYETPRVFKVYLIKFNPAPTVHSMKSCLDNQSTNVLQAIP